MRIGGVRRRQALRAGVALGALLLLNSVAPTASQAAAVSWNGSSGTNWDTSGNWTGTATKPASSDAVTIGSATNQPTVTNTSEGTLVSLTVNSGGQLTMTGGSASLSVGGTSTGLQGVGTIITTNGATLNLTGSTATNNIGTLNLTGATGGNLQLGTRILTVSSDYNGNFGSGNSFNKKSGVSFTAGSGKINAAGSSPSTAQSVSGASGVTGGTTSTPTLAFGNVHVGTSTTLNYQVNNSNSGGPTLRGAIQTGTTAGGLAIDGRLSGTGDTAGIWTATQGGNSGSLGVTFNATTAGALTNQKVKLVNNFDNVTEQTMSITGAAYNYASLSVGNTQPIGFGNVHVGATANHVLQITNNAAAGAFSEKLDVSVLSTDPGVTTNNGTISLLAAGSTNNTSIIVGINTATAGDKTGNVVLAPVSDGTGTSGLGNTALSTPAATVAVSGAVYNYAAATLNSPQSLSFGNYHVNDTVTQQAVSITNSAPTGSYSEKLDVSVGGTSGGAVTNGGGISLLAAGSTNASAITVGIDTTSAGDKSGTVTLATTSDGTATSGLGNTAGASQVLNVSGGAYNYAVATVNNTQPIAFGIVHIGDSVASQELSISNTADAGAYSEALNVSVGAMGAGLLTNNGSISQLAAGDTNSSAITIGIDTSTVGDRSGSVTLSTASDGTGTSGLGVSDLGPQDVQVTGQVNNYAKAGLNKTAGDGTFTSSGTNYTLDFGDVLPATGLLGATLQVQNIAEILADILTGQFSIISGNGLFGLSGFDQLIDGLDAGDTSSDLIVSANPTSVGLLTEVLDFRWYGYNIGGYSDPIPQDIYLTITMNVVPEPGTLGILLASLSGLMIAAPRRFRRKR